MSILRTVINLRDSKILASRGGCAAAHAIVNGKNRRM